MNNELETACNKFIQHCRQKLLSVSTINSYNNFQLLLCQFLKSLSICEPKQITEKNVSDFFYFLRTVKKNERRRFNNQTVYHIICMVKSLFVFLTNANIIVNNPAEAIHIRPNYRQIPRDVLTESEIVKIRKVFSKNNFLSRRNHVIFDFLYNTGLRVGEVSKLNLHDVDIYERLLYIKRTKSKKNRVIPLNKYIAHRLENYLLDVRPKFRAGIQHTDAFFLNRKAARITRDNITKMLKKAVVTAGIEKHITAHSLRHTFATHLLKNGASIRYISDLLGHEFLSTTEIYTRVVPMDLREQVLKYHPRAR